MKSPLRLLAVAGALGAASLSLSACDASPYAARVNGHVISQLQLNTQLKELASTPQFVSYFNTQSSSSNGGSGAVVAGTGGPGTYSQTFVSAVLRLDVEVAAMDQHLAATGRQPGPDALQAARGLQEASSSSYWDQLPPSQRDFLTRLVADEGMLTPVSTDTAGLQNVYAQLAPYIFSQVCVQQATAFSQADAAGLIASGNPGGSQICYDQQALEAQPAAFQAAVRGLKTGQLARTPVKTSYGYVVLKLISRDGPGLTDGVKRVLSLTSATSVSPEVSSTIQRASVKVNPAYGTWSNGQVQPPSAPKA